MYEASKGWKIWLRTGSSKPCIFMEKRHRPVYRCTSAIFCISGRFLPTPSSSPSFKISSPQREIKTLFMYFDAETWAAECRNNSAGVFFTAYACKICMPGTWKLQRLQCTVESSKSDPHGWTRLVQKKNNSPLKPSIQNTYPNSHPAYDSASPLRNHKTYFERVARQRGMIRSTTSSVHKHPSLRFFIEPS